MKIALLLTLVIIASLNLNVESWRWSPQVLETFPEVNKDMLRETAEKRDEEEKERKEVKRSEEDAWEHHLPKIPVEAIFYSTQRIGPVITGTMDVNPYQLYHVKIEVMKTDLDGADERIDDIYINGENFGSCNPDANDCTYWDCSQSNHGDSLTKSFIRSSNGLVNIRLLYSSTVNNCEHTCLHHCSWNSIKVQALAHVTLTPFEETCEDGIQNQDETGVDCGGPCEPCIVNGGWGNWGDWEACSVSCGDGDQDRTRACDSPAPQFGGDECSGSASETQSCKETPCPIHGGWGEWQIGETGWGVDECPVTCGGADQIRTRVCDNPAPQYGGDECTVDGTSASETQRCNENACPIHGNWGDWQAGSTGWGDDECPVGCGGATQNRTRACDNPAPQFGGEECPVEGVDGPSDYETRTCNDGTCPVDCKWSEFGGWGTCDKTCGGGTQSRERNITINAENGGKPCTGASTEKQSCNTQACPVDCEWSEFGGWSICDKSCGDGMQSRERTKTTLAQNGGNECTGDATEQQSCNIQACPAPYNKKTRTWCTPYDWQSGSYYSLSLAKSACNSVSGCTRIYDAGCDNRSYYLCKSSSTERRSSAGSCLYVKA